MGVVCGDNFAILIKENTDGSGYLAATLENDDRRRREE